jgi:hypothetical protein
MRATAKFVDTLASCFYVFFIISALAEAQTTGRIAGVIRDVQSAVIPGAVVSIEDPVTAVKHAVTTDTFGNYSILQLPPGTYHVRISAPGFTPAIVHQLAIGLAETTRLNTTLQIAHSNEQNGSE